MDLETYIDDFASLHRKTVNGEKAPHKPVLLLSIINLFERGIIQDNYIVLDNSLKIAFAQIWKALVTKSKGNFSLDVIMPMWQMHKEIFWHLIPTQEYTSRLRALKKEILEVSEDDFRTYVDHVELDSELAFILTLEFARERLKEILLSTYFNKSLAQYKIMENGFSYDENESIEENEESDVQQDPFDMMNEDLRLLFHVEYYTFLKNNTDLRRSFISYFPSVKEFYNKLIGEKLHYYEVSQKFRDAYYQFLKSFNYKLEAEEESMFLMEDVKQCIKALENPSDVIKPAVEDKVEEKQGQSYGVIKNHEEEDIIRIENNSNHTRIYDAENNVVYASTGMTVKCEGLLYRISKNYSSLSINTIDDLAKGGYMTGLRIANMNSRSALYKALKTQEIIQQLLIIKQDDDSYQFMLKGFTYSANGDVLSFKKTYETDSLPANQSNENEKTVTSEIVNESITPDVEAFINQSFNYLPKGNLPGIVNYADSSFDFFWIMSIIDMMKTKSHPKIISFDELGLMMIANAWEILNEYPIFADKIDGLNKCIDYIKKKYPNIVETCSKGRRILYQELHILLQDNIIKHAIEIMTNKSSYNVLRTWFKTDNDSQIYIKSLSFGNACLYAIYPREEDPYIYFNSSWQWLFLTDNAKLYKYFKIKLLKYLVEKNKD